MLFSEHLRDLLLAKHQKRIAGLSQNAALTESAEDDILRKHKVPASGYSFVDVPNNASGGLEAVLSGNTVTNLLGETGNAESLTDWGAAGGSLALDTSNKVFGSTSIKYTTTQVSGTGQVRCKMISVDDSKYYFLSGYVYADTANNKYIRAIDEDASTILKSTSTTTTTSAWERMGLILNPTELTGCSNLRLDACQAITAIGQELNVDGFMIREITADEYADGVTALLQKYNYVGSTQNAGPQRLVSVGENLLDKNKVTSGYYLNSSGALVLSTDWCVSDPIVAAGLSAFAYSPGQDSSACIAFFDLNDNFISAIALTTIYSSKTFTTPSGTAYFRASVAKGLLDATQIELGSVTTPYVPYSESVAYVPAPGNSLPNGVADEIDLLTGKKTQNVQEYMLQASDIVGYTAYTNTARVYIEAPSDAVAFSNDVEGTVRHTTHLNEIALGDTASDAVSNIGSFATRDNQRIYFVGDISVWTDLSAAQAALAGTVIYYQLATPIETDVNIRGRKDFKDYQNGTVYTEPSLWGCLSAATTIITTSDRPIKSIRKVVRFDVAYGEVTETDVTSNASTSDNLSLTISGYDSTKTYFYDCEYGTQYSANLGIALNCEVDNGIVEHDFGAAAAPWTLTDNEAKAAYLSCTNAGGAANIVAPACDGKQYIVRNWSGYTLTVKTSSGTGVTVATAKTATVIYIGTDFIKISEV